MADTWQNVLDNGPYFEMPTFERLLTENSLVPALPDIVEQNVLPGCHVQVQVPETIHFGQKTVQDIGVYELDVNTINGNAKITWQRRANGKSSYNEKSSVNPNTKKFPNKREIGKSRKVQTILTGYAGLVSDGVEVSCFRTDGGPPLLTLSNFDEKKKHPTVTSLRFNPGVEHVFYIHPTGPSSSSATGGTKPEHILQFRFYYRDSNLFHDFCIPGLERGDPKCETRPFAKEFYSQDNSSFILAWQDGNLFSHIQNG